MQRTKVKLRARGPYGLMDAPIVDGKRLDRVTRVEMVADATSGTTVTITVLPEFVFNGRAFVNVVDLDLDPGMEARKEFVQALNDADRRARKPGAHSTSVEALVAELDKAGWGFYRRTK